MSLLEALILGIIQGLTEFLPVSSSGHLELGKAILNVELEENLSFTVLVHFATVLSTILVFKRTILELIKGVFSLRWNEEKKYILLIIYSMIPVLIVGLFFKDQIESMFSGNILLVGCALLYTSFLLFLTSILKGGKSKITVGRSILIGIAQAIAVIPGVSRSGSTIATALMLKSDKDHATRFSFLMVLIPIIGASILLLMDIEEGAVMNNDAVLPLVIGFLAAFVSGWIACRWMLKIVRKGKLSYFAVYCLVVGLIAIGTDLFHG